MLLLLLGAACLWSAAPAAGDVVTATWTGQVSDDWNVGGNWDIDAVPNNSLNTQYDVVIDTANEEPYIENVSITINSLTIDVASAGVEIRDDGVLKIDDSAGLDSDGTITVKAGGRLELDGGNTTCDKIVLEGKTGSLADRARLRILSDTTLLSGGEIEGTDPDDTSGTTPPDGIIDGTATLTLASGAEIHGELEIQALLANNGLVDADDSEGKIHLTSNNKSGGSGAEFKATAGTLEVDIDVTGSADWVASGSGYLLVDEGDISGTDMDVLRVNNVDAKFENDGQLITLAGNLDVSIQTDANWKPSSGTWKFTGGTAQSYVTIELASEDVFAEGPWDWAWPYSWMGMGHKVIIGEGAHVRGVDLRDNDNTGGQHCDNAKECFFVYELYFEDLDGRYDRNGRDAHSYIDNDAGGQIEGDGFCP